MAKTLPANSIFICYRRLDSEEMVDRVYDSLIEEFSKEAIFRDVDKIPPGVDFPTYIEEVLRNSAVVLVFIGRDWITSVDNQGCPRLKDPADHVRIEIETAMALQGVRVIPVLVRHAEMPHSEELPESLRPLSRRNGVRLRSAGHDYRNDIAGLARVLRRSVAEVLETRSQLKREERDLRAAEAHERETIRKRQHEEVERRKEEVIRNEKARHALETAELERKLRDQRQAKDPLAIRKTNADRPQETGSHKVTRTPLDLTDQLASIQEPISSARSETMRGVRLIIFTLAPIITAVILLNGFFDDTSSHQSANLKPPSSSANASTPSSSAPNSPTETAKATPQIAASPIPHSGPTPPKTSEVTVQKPSPSGTPSGLSSVTTSTLSLPAPKSSPTTAGATPPVAISPTRNGGSVALKTPAVAAKKPSSGTTTAELSTDPGDLFVNAYLAVQAGEQAEQSGNLPEAISKLSYAARVLDQIAKTNPTWQSPIIDYRTKRTAESLARLQDKLAQTTGAKKKGGAPPAGTARKSPAQAPSTPAAAKTQELEQRIEKLQKDLERAKAEREGVISSM